MERKKEPISIAAIVDARGLFCPLPVIQTEKKLRKLKTGQVVRVLADDPTFEEDIRGWCRRSGNQLLGMDRKKKAFLAYVKKK